MSNQTKSTESKESSGRGGKRAGAGRKKGSLTQKTREIAEAAVESGITPLEYMLRVMRQQTEHEDPKIQAQREALAFDAAKAAAPYMHPRLATVEHTGQDGGAIEHSVRVTFVD
jgi:hypothetical protein